MKQNLISVGLAGALTVKDVGVVSLTMTKVFRSPPGTSFVREVFDPRTRVNGLSKVR